MSLHAGPRRNLKPVPLTRLSHLASKAQQELGRALNYLPFRSARSCLDCSPTGPI